MKKIITFLLLLMVQSYSVLAESKVVAIQEEKIVMINLGGNQVVTLNEGADFFQPRISNNKQVVAYKDQKSNLYLSSLTETQEIVKIESIKGYTWNENQLIFSKNEGGVYQIDPETKEVSIIIENSGYLYDQLMMNHQGLLVAKKYVVHGKDYLPIGIIEYDTKSLDEWIIVPYEPVTKTVIGLDPSIVKLSSDGNLIYIWCKPNNDTADGLPLGVYDMTTDQFRQFDDIMMLSYEDNLALSPISNDVVAIIRGEGRFMNENKHLELFNVKNESLIPVLSNDIAAMSPSFSHDGTKLFYSAGREIKGEYKSFVSGANQIYVYDLKSKVSSQLTDDQTGFDFYPQEIENQELLFLRLGEGENLSLIRRDKEGQEVILLENLLTYNFEVYGHIDAYEILDVKY